MARKSAAPTELQLREARIVAEAVHWTAYMRRGPWEIRKVEVATRAEATTAAHRMAEEFGEGRRGMVYAVDGQGRDTLVGSVAASGTFYPATIAG